MFYNNDFITPGAEVLWKYATMHGNDPSSAYLRLSAKHEFAVTDTITITPKTVLGIGDHAFTKAQIAGYRDNSRDNYGVEMTDHTTGVTVAWDATDWLTLSVMVNYTWIPSHSLRQERWMTAGHDSRNGLVWGGVNATVSF